LSVHDNQLSGVKTQTGVPQLAPVVPYFFADMQVARSTVERPWLGTLQGTKFDERLDGPSATCTK